MEGGQAGFASRSSGVGVVCLKRDSTENQRVPFRSPSRRTTRAGFVARWRLPRPDLHRIINETFAWRAVIATPAPQTIRGSLHLTSERKGLTSLLCHSLGLLKQWGCLIFLAFPLPTKHDTLTPKKDCIFVRRGSNPC